MRWLIGILEEILTAFVPGGEVLAVTCVRPLRWRAEDRKNRPSLLTLASDLRESTVTLLKFSYIYRGLVALRVIRSIRK